MANAILQQSSLELTQSIEAELLENPALDAVDQDPICTGQCLDPASCPVCSRRRTHTADDELRSEMYQGDGDPLIRSFWEGDSDFDVVANIEAEVTLQDHLRSLLRAAVPDDDYLIGEYIVNNLDDNGWLDTDPEEIAADLGADVEDVMRVLAVVQSLDPPGVGARDLRECMQIQLRFLREEGVGNVLAERMLQTHFKDVVQRRYAKLARAMGVTVEKARETLEYMREHLNPYPASQFRPPWASRPRNNKAAVRPDVVIRRTEIGYEVEVVGAEPFVLGVNPTYREAYHTIQTGNGHMPEDDRKHVVEYVERAELFIKNLNQRRRTLKQITKCIIDLQQGFLETGSRAYLLPLTRTRVADVLGMHESTVSRATAKKYVQLPNQEVVPFDVFFNASLSVKSAIEEIIASEDPARPVSDQQIVEILAERGIVVARRTVVKYREAQKILSSNRRRR